MSNASLESAKMADCERFPDLKKGTDGTSYSKNQPICAEVLR